MLSDIKNIFWKRRFMYQINMIFADIDNNIIETNISVVMAESLDFAYLPFLCEYLVSYLQ